MSPNRNPGKNQVDFHMQSEGRLKLSLREPSGRFERQQHHALAEGGAQKAVVLVETDRVVVDRVRDNASRPDDFRGRQASAQRVREQIRSEPDPVKRSIDGEPADQKQRDLLRHAAAQPGIRQCNPLLHGRGYRVVADYSRGHIGVAHYIGSCGQAFAGGWSVPEPII